MRIKVPTVVDLPFTALELIEKVLMSMGSRSFPSPDIEPTLIQEATDPTEQVWEYSFQMGEGHTDMASVVLRYKEYGSNPEPLSAVITLSNSWRLTWTLDDSSDVPEIIQSLFRDVSQAERTERAEFVAETATAH